MAGAADEIIVQLTADSSGLAAGLQAAADEVQSAAAQMNEAAQSAGAGVGSGGAAASAGWDALAANIVASTDTAKAAIADMADAARAQLTLLADVAAGTATTFDELVAQESALVAAFDSGTISASAYSDAMDALDAQTAVVTATTDAAAAAQADLIAAQMAQTTAWAADDAAIGTNTAELEANTGARMENASAGSHMHGFGVFRTVTAIATSPAALPLGVGAVMAGSAFQAEEHVAALNQAIQVMGDNLGVSSGQIDQWAQAVGSSDATIGDAQEVYQKLALSGEFVGEELHQAGQAAVIFAEMTGSSMSAAATAVEKMGKDPLSALKYLTGAQQAEVQSLVDVGDKADAASVAIKDFDQSMQAAAKHAGGDVGILTELGDAWDKLGRAVAVNSGGGTSQMKLANLELMRERIANSPTALNEGLGSQLGPLDAQIAALKAHIAAQEKTAQLQEIQSHIIMPVAGYGANALKFDTHQMLLHEADARMTPAQRTAYETSTWTHLLNTAPKGSAEYMAAYQHTSMAAVHAGKALGMPGANSTHAPTVGRMGHFDTAMMDVEAHHIAAQQHAAQTGRQISAITLESTSAHQVATQQLQQQHIQAMVGMGTMGAASAVAQEQTIADKIYQIKLAELEKEKALQATKPVEAARINSEIVRLQDSHTATMQSLGDKAAAQQIKTSEAVVQPILSTFSQVTAGFVEGTLTRQQAELRLGQALVAETINTGIHMLMQHIAIEEAKTVATALGSAERVALTIAAEAESAAIHVVNAVEWIITEAAKAAASAFSAMAGIPIVGPALAIAASVAAGAEVLSLVGRVASAEGGWGQVPMDNAPAMLHKDEMVLPADLAEGVRNMSGSGGNTYHYHIHANDAAGFEGMLKRNPGALVRALGHAHAVGAMA